MPNEIESVSQPAYERDLVRVRVGRGKGMVEVCHYVAPGERLAYRYYLPAEDAIKVAGLLIECAEKIQHEEALDAE